METRFAGKTAVITGASRGIGRAIALKLAAEGANVVIAAKTTDPHPKLEGTIHTVAEEVTQLGARALAVQVDVRNEEEVANLVRLTEDAFGGIDILVNNASAISLTSAEQTPLKRYDLMQDINVRGTFLMSQACIPLLKRSNNAHILTLSPPIDLNPRWFGRHLAYTMSKYGMSMVVLGLAEELRKYNIAVNALWPKTIIATAAVSQLPGGEQLTKKSRKPQIMADAAAQILLNKSAECSGKFFVDEEVLRQAGVHDFDAYAVVPGSVPMKDLFL